MSDIIVFRDVNLFYYIVFIAYIIIFLIYIIPKRKQVPYINAYKIFWATSIVLIAMEFFGTFTGIRVFYIGGKYILGVQLILQIIMGFAEGGASTGIMYLMVEAVYNKDVKKFFKFVSFFSVFMLVFAFFTFLYKIY